MTVQSPPETTTQHAIEAVKHLWMVPYTMAGTPDPSEGFTESISKDAQYSRRNVDDESFWHFTASAVAYAHIAANAVINTLANRDNREEVGEINAELIDEALEEANRFVTTATAAWFRAAEFHFKLGDVVYDLSNVNDHPSGFDCTRNTSQNVSWFHCADADRDRQAPCLNCPSVQKLGNPIYSTKLDRNIETILKAANDGRQEPDLQQLGPLPPPEGPATHCRHAIQLLAKVAERLDHGSVNHRGIAYAALAANDAMTELRYLEHQVDMDEDVIGLAADADRVTAEILSGEPIDGESEFTRPDDHDECIFQRELTTGQAEYICAPPDAPYDWTADDCGYHQPCRICPMRSAIPETAMDRMLHQLTELPESA